MPHQIPSKQIPCSEISHSFSAISLMLDTYKEKIEEKIDASLLHMGPKNQLRDAAEYALKNGGKRFRPALVMMIAKAIGKNFDVSGVALATEFFHTASLIADDLPCMDDADERRNKPPLHKVYGESIALLTSYALIAEGYACISLNAKELNEKEKLSLDRCDRLCALALENATMNTGFLGATGGQYLDLFPPNLAITTLKEVIYKKTTSLFELAFILGWLYGGGEIVLLDEVKKAAGHFGMAFQIADDLGDMEQDIQNGRLINIANALGKEKALEMFHEEIQSFKITIQKLAIQADELYGIIEILYKNL